MFTSGPKILSSPNYSSALIMLLAAGVSSCGVGPKIGSYQAHAVAQKKWSKAASLLPALSASTSRRLTDNIDVGIQLESFVSLSSWIKYRFVHNPAGFAFAGVAGAFVGSAQYSAEGFYAGPVVSYKLGGWVLATAARAHKMSYEPAGEEPNSFHEEESGPRITTDELEEYYSIDLTAAYSWRNRTTFLLGVRCGDDQRDDRDNFVYGATFGCLPVLGISINQ